MKTTRKLLVVVMAAGLAAASAVAFADPSPGCGPGVGPCAVGGGGPGMMGGGWGGGPMGPGMGYGPRGGYGPGAAQGQGPRGGFGPGAGAGPVANQEARLAFLKQELKITADQDAAWNAYATQVKAQAATMETFHTQAPAAAQSADERIAQRAEFMRLRSEQMKAASAAVKDLYAVLTPEQKATADQHFGGPRMARGGGYGRWR